MRFGVIYADPPWEYKTWTAKGGNKSASAHYNVQAASWIHALPVADVAAPDCCLFMWATFPNLPEGIETVRAWGFDFKTVAFVWVKTVGGFEKPRMGTGYWSRSNAEICIFATRGKPQRLNKDVEQIVACPIGRHSEKPIEVYDRIERLVGGPYLEIFGRPLGPLMQDCVPHWTRLGNEITGNDMAFDLRRVAALPEQESPVLERCVVQAVELAHLFS